MITEPWRTGPDDYVRASGLETEFDPAKHPRQLASGDARAQWFASYTRLKQEWRSRIVAALDAGTITIETEGLHIDALGLIHTELTARRKREETARRADLESTNTYDTVDQLKLGDRPWCRRFGERVLVIRTHRSSVEVKTSRNNVFKIALAERSLRRKSPAEIEAEVRRPAQSTPAPMPPAATETSPAEVPAANESNEQPGSEIVKSETESSVGAETIDATEIRVEVIDADNRLVRIGPTITLPMRLDFADGQPRARDEEVAKALGFERTRDIRKLLGRLRNSGRLPDIYVRAMTARTSMPNGGTRETQVDEYWLTERETLLVATQSETKEAWKITNLIVDVFRAAMRGHVRAAPPQPAPQLSVSDISTMIATAISAAMVPVVETIRAEIRDRDQRTPPAQLAAPAATQSVPQSDLTAGTRYAREITGRITKAAHTAVAAQMGTFGRLRKQFEDRVRTAIGFPRESAHRWENLPMSRLEEARLAVAKIESEVQAQAEKHFRASQLRLIPGGANT